MEHMLKGTVFRQCGKRFKIRTALENPMPLVVFRLGVCGWVKLHLRVSGNHRWLGPRKDVALAKR